MANLVLAEIQEHLHDIEWLQALISQHLASKLVQILESHRHWCDDQDENNPETTDKHYPEKGVLLYSIDIKPEDRKWSEWSERHHVYLLETGQFVKVEARSNNDTVRTSMIHWADSQHTNTEMEVWSSEQVEVNRQKLVEALVQLLGINQDEKET